MKGKEHYSYFLIKPDGIRYFNEIKQEICEKGFDRVMFFAVEDWEKLQKDLYEKHFQKTDFAKGYRAFVDAEKVLYGNKAIVILVSSDKEYEELVNEVYDLKIEIRKKLAYKVGLVTISDKKEQEQTNQVILIDSDGTSRIPKRFNDRNKRYNINHLDVIHCPDASLDATLGELKKLITDKNIISSKLDDNICKYKTAEFIQDINENQLYTCDYSSNIMKEVEDDIEK